MYLDSAKLHSTRRLICVFHLEGVHNDYVVIVQAER